MEYIKFKIALVVAFFFAIQLSVLSQQVYFLQGKSITVDSLMSQYKVEDAIKKIELLAKQPDKNLSAREQLEFKLQLELLKAKVYDRNFEQDKALVILLDLIEQAEAEDFYSITAEAYLLMAQVKRNGNDIGESDKYLSLAKSLVDKHKLDKFYSSYYYQKASSYRLKNDFNAVLENGKKALQYGEKYANDEDIALANTIIGVGYGGKGEKQNAIDHFNKVIPYYKNTNNYTFLAMMYRNISREYFRHNEIQNSHHYIDSAYLYYDKMSYFYKEFLPLMRLDLYAHESKWDSAFVYLSAFHNESFKNLQLREASKIKDISEQYENDKKEAEIKNKNQQMILIGILLVVIVAALVLVYFQNGKIKKRNKIINSQLTELSAALKQKQVLLSELQHRVKNNLQHVISILEIQRESVDFNNIDELIRGIQNRIHSMALIHNKLTVSDNVNEVDLARYVAELSELVKESYDKNNKKINLHVDCDPKVLSIEKSLSLGLIIAELVSNSMKHAFTKRNVGDINIEIKKDEKTEELHLLYSDNGEGFDFNRTSKRGLGQEIIKGLIDQLGAKVATRNVNGFELRLDFV